jgi:hypothetical protein
MAKTLPQYILEEENKNKSLPSFLEKLGLKPLQPEVQQLTGTTPNTSNDHH